MDVFYKRRVYIGHITVRRTAHEHQFIEQIEQEEASSASGTPFFPYDFPPVDTTSTEAPESNPCLARPLRAERNPLSARFRSSSSRSRSRARALAQTVPLCKPGRRETCTSPARSTSFSNACELANSRSLVLELSKPCGWRGRCGGKLSYRSIFGQTLLEERSPMWDPYGGL